MNTNAGPTAKLTPESQPDERLNQYMEELNTNFPTSEFTETIHNFLAYIQEFELPLDLPKAMSYAFMSMAIIEMFESNNWQWQIGQPRNTNNNLVRPVEVTIEGHVFSSDHLNLHDDSAFLPTTLLHGVLATLKRQQVN